MDGLLCALLGLACFIGEVPAQDYSELTFCDDEWDVRYPYLVEVRYSGPPFLNDVGQRNYHKNRHGALLTSKSVLTRGHDLDDYPLPAEDWKHRDVEACIRAGVLRPCLYVNTRRPRSSTTGLCGQNILVEKAIQHPYFLRTANQTFYDLRIRWRNTRFPFAVLVLKEEVAVGKLV